MKVLTVTGTRPELIRLSLILKGLDEVLGRNHVHVYTNQNYDPNLSDIFLKELQIKVDYIFSKTEGIADFLSNGFKQFAEVLEVEKPSKVLILGDTNSSLLAILAAKKGIPVYHMEAGNRCYDNAVPEETNRTILDACSYMNLPYTENSKENLIKEGYHKNRVFKVGNPIWEVLKHYLPEIDSSRIHFDLGLVPHEWPGVVDDPLPYALFTFHRTENVDTYHVAKSVIDAMNEIAEEIPVVFPLHPRTADQFDKKGIHISPKVKVTKPLGFFDFVKLEKHAKIVLTDSGTVPEETGLFRIPCIVLRNTTERQELMEQGVFTLSGYKKEDILRAYNTIKRQEKLPDWYMPDDYTKENVEDTVIKILTGLTPTIIRKGHDEY